MSNLRQAIMLMRVDEKRYRKLARQAKSEGENVRVPVNDDETVDELEEVVREQWQVEALLCATGYERMADMLEASLSRLEKL